MSRAAWRWIVAVVLLLAVGFLVGVRDFGAASSALSRDARGWLAARRYLEARGARVHLRDRPLAAGEEPGGRTPDGRTPDGLLVLAFPWQQPVTGGDLQALGRYLRSGGTVLLAYSGEALQFPETRVFEALGLEAADVRPPPPLAPLRWWSYHRELWRLRPAGEIGAGWPELAVGAFRRAPVPPARARVLYRGGAEDRPLVFDYPLHRGRVVALPAELFANAGIHRAGNADLLETLFGRLGPEWSFDEYHHGLVATEAVAASSSRFAWDLFVAHLALVYLLGVVVLGRRFGPAWREPPAAAGSTASFLRHFGALHHRLRHHAQAAELLAKHARAYDPDLPLAARSGRGVRDAPGLVGFAREIARAQRRRYP